MTKLEIKTHANHYCKNCGCKYGDIDCPVVNGNVEQTYECKSCKKEYIQLGIEQLLHDILVSVQKQTIGVHCICELNELVIEESECTFKTIRIGTFGGLTTSHYPKSIFNFTRIPKSYNSLHDLLNNHEKYYQWYNLNLNKK